MNRLVKIFCCVLLMANTLLSNAQKTYATISVSNKVFSDIYEGGAMVGAYVKVVAIAFYVDGQYVGRLYKSDLTATGVSQITGIVVLPNASNLITIGVTYSHKEWNLAGTIHDYPSLYIQYPLGNTTVGRSVSTKQTFNQFPGLDATITVPWTFDYTISITAFAPTISFPDKPCNNVDETLTLNSNNPSYYDNSGVYYHYQAGIFNSWEYSTGFNSYLNDIVYWLQNKYPGDTESSSFINIQTAIYNTNYSFMQAYYSLYSGNNTSEIATLLCNGIISQNYDLTQDEKNFIYANFYQAVLNQPSCPSPYNLVIATWKDIGYSFASNGSKTFVPEDLVSASTATKTKIGFRARAFVSGIPGPFSDIHVSFILPTAPNFDVSATPSCAKPTGEIKITGITGVTGTSDYYYYNVTLNSNIYASGYFSGSSITLPEKYAKGVYKVYLYYGDESIQGCSNVGTITIDEEKPLIYKHVTQDVTCPEKTDGIITLEVTSFARNYQININGKVFVDSPAALTELIPGDYPIIISDYCTTINPSVTIKPATEVTITAVPESPNCLSNPNGKITMKISGGSKPYSFGVFNESGTIINSEYNRINNDTTFITSSLNGGTYLGQARSKECQWKTTSVSLTPVQPMQILVDNKKDVTCYGQNTGEIKVSGSGGFTPYTFTINNNSNTSEPFNKFSNLAAGTYSLAVKSNGGAVCNDIATTIVTITTPAEIIINPYEIKNVNCNGGSDGSIQTTVNGGTNVFSYIWLKYNNAWNTIQNETTSSLMNIEAGDYRLSVTDSWGCSKSIERKISQPDELIINNVIPNDIVCLGETGSLNIFVQGGTKNYQYLCTREDDNTVITGTNSTVRVPAGGYYVEVRDAHGCSTTYGNDSEDFITTITEPYTELDFELSSPEYNGFNIPCSGDLLGSISVSAWGGNDYDYEGYKYSISGLPFQIEETFNNLPAGTFSLRVMDGRGCIVEKPFVLTEPDPLHLTILPTEHIKCFGEPTGKIMVIPAGGIEDSYKYKLDGNDISTPGLFEHLYAGTYEIEVSDKNSCRYNVFETVNHLYPPISITMLPDDVRCFDEGNGKINTVVTGGSGGFTYLWELQNGDQWLLQDGTTDNRTNLVPGYYRIKATDSENCFLYNGAQINEPAEFLIPEATSKDIVCLGEKGSINISAIGGNGENKYYCREEAGAVFESTDPLLQLPAGIFTVDATDKKGCLAAYTAELTITEPEKALDFKTELSSYTGYGVSCYGKSDGIIIFEATGGNSHGYSGYKYSVSGSPFDANNYYSYLPKGLHTVSVTDGRGCIVQKSVELTEPTELAINLLHSKPVPCFGKPTGEIAVEATGGIENTYSYTVDGKEFPSGVFGGLYAGKHRVTAEDLNGCLVNLLATIEQTNPAVMTNLSSFNVRCYGEENGKISSDITGGTGSFSISWEKKTGKEWHALTGNSDTLKDIAAGFYRIKTIDTDDCIVYDSIEVSEPDKLTISEVTINDAACFGDKGNFDIKANGGNDGNEFYCSADNGLSFTSYSPGSLISAGSYLLKVNDSKGCVSITPETYTITNPDKPLSFEYLTAKYSGYDISCHGNNDGRISVTASGGNGHNYRGYFYSLSGSEESHENVFDSLVAGNYEISVTDGRGCRLIKTISLTEPESEITLKASSFKRPLCIYDNTGEVKLSALGGTQPYKYSANDGFYSSSPEFTGLPARKYTFRVKDVNGCVETFDTTIISLVSQINITADITDVKCFNENTGAVEVSINGGTRPYTYAWKNHSSASSKASGLVKGTYTVSITDSEGCKAEKTFEIKQPGSPLRIAATSISACAETRNGQLSITANGGTPPYRYAVDNKSDLTTFNTFNVFSGVHKAFTSDANNCISETSVDVAKRNLMPEINFMLATSRFELDTLVILDVSVPKPDKVCWTFSDDAVIIDTSSNKARVKYNQSGIYPVTMTGLFGTCSYSIEKLLNIAPFDPILAEKDKNLKSIKSVKISPNPNDGRFELRIELYSKQEVIVKVFDLYSRLIYNENYAPEIKFTEEIILSESVMPGTYVLWILTEYDAHSSVFIISE